MSLGCRELATSGQHGASSMTGRLLVPGQQGCASHWVTPGTRPNASSRDQASRRLAGTQTAHRGQGLFPRRPHFLPAALSSAPLGDLAPGPALLCREVFLLDLLLSILSRQRQAGAWERGVRIAGPFQKCFSR